jgi:hypothetical protein
LVPARGFLELGRNAPRIAIGGAFCMSRAFARNESPPLKVHRSCAPGHVKQLTAWIEELRGRLERGELAEAGPVCIPPWVETDDAEACVGGLLREVDYWRAKPLAERRLSAPQGIRGRIAKQLTPLYQELVEGKTRSEPLSPLGPRRNW